MASMQDKLLKLLIKKYENSRTYDGSNKVNQSFSVKPDRVMKDYYSDYADPDEIADFENSLSDLEGRGWISLEHKKNSDVISSIRLNASYIDEIREQTGLRDKNLAIEDEIGFYSELRGYIEGDTDCDHTDKEVLARGNEPYSGLRLYESITEWYCSEEIGRLKGGRKARYSREEARNLLGLASFILANNEECLERELSMRFFGDSKTFESGYRHRVCRLIDSYLRYRGLPGTEEGLSDNDADRQLLEEFGIYRNPSYVHINGHACIKYADGKQLETEHGMPLALSGALLDNIAEITIEASMVMTVENLTSYHRMNNEEFFYIYTGGYHGRTVRQLISKLKSSNPHIGYLHFGDIDPDGFMILEHLKRSCKIPARPVHMGISELDRYRSCTKPLTDSDRSKADKLISQGKYSDILKYMIAHDIKLEQEIVAYEL